MPWLLLLNADKVASTESELGCIEGNRVALTKVEKDSLDLKSIKLVFRGARIALSKNWGVIFTKSFCFTKYLEIPIILSISGRFWVAEILRPKPPSSLDLLIYLEDNIWLLISVLCMSVLTPASSISSFRYILGVMIFKTST